MAVEVGYAEGSGFAGPKGFGSGSSAEVSQVEVGKQPAVKLGIFLFIFCYGTIF